MFCSDAHKKFLSINYKVNVWCMCSCLFVFCKSYILFIIVQLQADFKYFLKCDVHVNIE